MPRTQQARFAFDAGVRSPTLTMRADDPLYKTACREIQNFIVTPQGTALMRPGSRHIGQPADPLSPFRVFAFKDGGDRSDTMFEVGPGLTRFWRDDQLIPNPTPLDLSIDNPYSVSDLPGLEFANQESLTVIVSENHPPSLVALQQPGTLLQLPLPFFRIPLQKFFDYKSPQLQGKAVSYEIVFDPAMTEGKAFICAYDGITNQGNFGTTYFNRQYLYSTDAPTMIATLTRMTEDIRALQNDISGLTVTGTGFTYTITFTSELAGRTLSLITVATPTIPNPTISIIAGLPNSGEEPAWSYPYVVEHNGSWYQCINPHNSDSTNEPGVGGLWTNYWIDLVTKPPWFAYQHADNNPWATDKIYAPWGRGFPTVCEFHEQRLALAGSREAPTNIWLSRIGVYNDFIPGANDTDPISFSLDTSDTPAIKWMTSTSIGLLLGTSAGEFIISAEVTLRPSDIEAQRQNYTRSAKARAAKMGSLVFYIELGGRKLRGSQYVRDSLGYVSADVSIAADHLFYNGATRLCAFRSPESVLVMLRQDGSLVGCTKDLTGPGTAFVELATGGGIYDINSLYDAQSGTDAIYMCVARAGEYHLEKLPYPSKQFIDELLWDQNAVYLDSWSKGTFTPGQLTITGLERFALQTVRLVVDDADDGLYQVDAAGVLDLGVSRPVAKYAVGLPYVGRINTYEMATDVNPAGVGFGTARRWNKLSVRLLASGLPLINGQLPADRTPSAPMNLPEPLRTFDARVHNIGWEDGSITLEQYLPFPTHILGVYGEFGTNNV